MKKKASQDEAAKILIGSFKQFMTGKTIDCRCPSSGALFFKYLIDRQLIEIHCKECSKRWTKLQKKPWPKSKSFIFHRFDVKMNLIETVIVDGNEEKTIERK